MRWFPPLALAVLAGACTFSPPRPVAPGDGGDGTRDAGVILLDTGIRDAGDEVDPTDGGGSDAATRDGGGVRDAGPPRDAGPRDAGPAFTPSNGIPPELIDQSTTAFVLTNGAFMNTDNGAMRDEMGNMIRAAMVGVDPISGIGFTQIPQTDLPPIGVFTFGSFEIQPGALLRVRGAGPVAIVVGDDVTLDGVIDVSGGPDACAPASPTCAGPGGRPGGDYVRPCCPDCLNIISGSCASCPATCTCVDPSMHPGDGKVGSTGEGVCYSEAGGGGGGFGGAGAVGGEANTNGNSRPGGVVTPGGAPGGVWGSDTLVPLHGGGGGGAGAPEDENASPGLGGGGGGAIQIVSGAFVRIGPSTTCGINAGGGGGGPSGLSEAGGGGGAGGGILIEALAVEIAADCYLSANGGAGSSAYNAAEAETGRLSAAPAQPSSPGDCSGGRGGEGASLMQPAAQPAEDCLFDCGFPEMFCAGTGGGGGGVGRIRINADSESILGTTSPAHSSGSLAR